MPEESESSPSKEWVLEPETEYRFELDLGTSLAIKLLRGNAEIFGAEMVEGKAYLFGQECKAAVFTWVGCTIQVTGQPSTEYVSEETPMTAYGNLHIALEQMRVRALAKFRGSPEPEARSTDAPAEPPRVLVLGPENAGKTTLCKILINYAVRAGQAWSPLLVNVDPGEATSAAPGALSATSVYSPLPTCSPSFPLGSAATSAPTSLGSNALLPVLYWYGHSSTTRNSLLMDRLIRNLGFNIDNKSSNDPKGQLAGIIVDTPSSFASGTAATNEQRQRLIKACIDAFKINIILVVGHEKLNVEMQRAYSSKLKVVKVPKSGGVVELDHGYRERIINYQFHGYMYGEVIRPPPGITSGTQGGEALTDLTLSPSSTVVNFSDLKIYRIGAATMAPSSALPIGATRSVSEMQPVLVEPSLPGSGLLNAILAVLSPFNPDENERYDEEILDLSVIGFIAVTHIDIPHQKLTVLSPAQGSLVGKTAIIGSYEWQE
ncbi:Cleavage polyadenylation factor subunit clp1 [Marasmius oreades]|uniref:Polynucleotide 5'-hydroxyl-kinase GRC3 n=1 Tax=Marasmius oreades TaxID=181124 RepID=A0A9P7RZM5_9AGAR|nr:Cleavage polyadenylation factor subunit clp1 [Marasmius oreades]KAG7092739.1 Cleavage polyadenylation factor subunit clp1 [Marasmius oreades]